MTTNSDLSYGKPYDHRGFRVIPGCDHVRTVNIGHGAVRCLDCSETGDLDEFEQPTLWHVVGDLRETVDLDAVSTNNLVTEVLYEAGFVDEIGSGAMIDSEFSAFYAYLPDEVSCLSMIDRAIAEAE